MKSLTLLSVALVANVASAVKFVNGPVPWIQSSNFSTIETPETVVQAYKRHANRLQQRATAPALQQLKTRTPHIPNSKSVKIRYGPYHVPGALYKGGEGMISNMPSPWVDRPCSDCMILGMNAGLEYPDGADANTDTLLWLHHMVMFNIGSGAWDATCTIFGAPHLIVGSMPQASERIFSSGNERTTTFFNPPWANVTNLGYPIYKNDRFGLIVDLMNMNTVTKPVYLTIYYDYVDGHPSHFEEVKPVWMDAAQCGTSEVSGRSSGSKWSFGSPPWIANFEGEVLGAGGHLHDGGIVLNINVDGKTVCKSTPTYGTDEQAKARADAAKLGEILPLDKSMSNMPAMSMPGMSGMSSQHIIAMSICAENKGHYNGPIADLGIKRLKKDQSWTLEAFYDYNRHAGMKNNFGGMSSVMGISIMYVKTDKKRSR